MDFETLCIHSERNIDNPTGAVATPIYQTATFAHPGPGETTGYDYSRQQNPTREQLEYVIAGLEGAAGALAFASGMAAVAALMELFSPGDHIIAANDLYGGTHRLFQQISEKNGLTFSAASETEQIEDLITPKTKAVFLETPTNPMMQTFNIARAAQVTAPRGILLIVDNTFLTPYFQKPLKLGADIVLHSGTKYLSGHNDTIAGFLAVKTPEVEEKLRFISKTTGAALAPFDSFLIIRGIKTLAARMEKQQENAKKIAIWLRTQQAVTAVHYPGIGAMISFRVTDKALAEQILARVQIIQYAESLGGTESLITYPVTQTHADVPEEERLAIGIDACLLRLSVGLESAADLTADLTQALGQ
ncbi:cystathionine gamma-synthase [Clostridia bacterium]|nr:cystathionine gamma-synthase [Clostridia bacterium]